MKVRNTTDKKIWVSALNGQGSVDLVLNPYETKTAIGVPDMVMLNITHAEEHRPTLQKLIHEAHENTDFDHVEIP